ncbi:hypothetical protein [Caldifermentibacillus hisashii]
MATRTGLVVINGRFPPKIGDEIGINFSINFYSSPVTGMDFLY